MRTILLAAALVAIASAATGARAAGRFDTRLSPDHRVRHAINRLTFGARPGDGDGVRKLGGWDHHQNEQGLLFGQARQLGTALAAFCTDMGDRMEDIVVVTMSDFGRTAQENGSNGTDHGHGSVMFVRGGPVHGGKIFGKWPGLEREQLYEGRELAVTTDFRAVLSELVGGHWGATGLGQVFPGFQPGEPLGLLRRI